jgi:UTP--glucose-1-phosphate uridylyltransferase
MVAAMEVPRARTQDYGVLDFVNDVGHLVEVRGMVEKPIPEAAPSTTAVIGRYILTPSVMRNLSKIRKGSGGEIQLTDAIAAEIAQGRKVYGHRFEGERFDCGSKTGYLKATVAFALARAELRDDLDAFLSSLYAMPGAAE